MPRICHPGRRACLTSLFAALLAAGCAMTPAPEPVVDTAPAPVVVGETAPLTAADLQPDHPQRYTVVKGDTLWDISGRFLTKPWYWPEIWRNNPHIRNPHLIYPGDVLEIYFTDGRPGLRVAGDTGPRVRSTSLAEAIPALPRGAIEPFLRAARVVDPVTWSGAPYTVALGDGRIIGGSGSRIYARGVGAENSRWQAFRLGGAYVDPVTGETLGQEALYVGEAIVDKAGDPAAMTLLTSRREALIGDRMFTLEDDFDATRYVPTPAPEGTAGQIIGVLDGVSMIGQYHTVVLNRGEREGLAPGHVLTIHQDPGVVRDAVASAATGKPQSVQLPSEEIGALMVYKSFDKVSYALVMDASGPIRLLDRVTTP